MQIRAVADVCETHKHWEGNPCATAPLPHIRLC